VPSIFKRTKNLIRATALANDTVAPSIRSVVEMHQHLSTKYSALEQDCQLIEKKIQDYRNLISMWSTRLERAISLMNYVHNAITEIEKRDGGVSSMDYEKYQEMLREFSILHETALEYVRIYGIALEKSTERLTKQKETTAKMSDTLYRLKSFERKYALKESLTKASAEINDPVKPELELQETREINRTLHTAEALLELKTEDHGWDFPALPE